MSLNLIEDHPFSSFLIRVWPEARETGGEAPLRVYVRDLRTGEEHYLAETAEIGPLLTRLQAASERAEAAGEPAGRRAGGADGGS